MKVAALADIHCRDGDAPRVAGLVEGVDGAADALVLAGDLTHHGTLSETDALVKGLEALTVPVITVLGNHDHESGNAPAVLARLTEQGIHALEASSVVVTGVGFAGVKGFCGGFDPHSVRPFGEPALKAFIRESERESETLARELAALPAGRRVAVTHFAPVVDTVRGEPPEIFPFLGTSLLARAMDEAGASLALHGHAHRGTFEGATPGGIPVRNVAEHVLRARPERATYWVFDA